jgi:hypothetical protein
MLIDEVHLLNEQGRGCALEAGVVARVRTLGLLPEMREVWKLTLEQELYPTCKYMPRPQLLGQL